MRQWEYRRKGACYQTMTRLTLAYATTLLAAAVPVSAASPALWEQLNPDAQIVLRAASQLATHRLDSTVSWESVSADLSDAKDAVNRMGTNLERYASSGDAAAKEAIERALPLLKQVSLDTTAALESIDTHHPLTLNPRLREALVKLDASAHQLARTVSESSRLEKLRAETARLQSDLNARSQPR